MTALKKLLVISSEFVVIFLLFLLLPTTNYLPAGRQGQLTTIHAQEEPPVVDESAPAESETAPAETDNTPPAEETTDPPPAAPEPSSSPFPLVQNDNGKGTPVTAKEWDLFSQGDVGILSIEHALFCGAAGESPVRSCVGIKNGANGKASLYFFDKTPGGGAIGGLSNMIAATYNRPTSSVHYLANLFENMGIAPKSAYAQVTGSGAGVIKPVEDLWKVTRNIAYIAFIIVFIVVGFMIMFRKKISSQAVISVQQALPGLVLGIVLVTFSYFIAALIIDISFLSIQLVAQVFVQTGAKTVIGDPQDLANNSNVFQMFISSIRFRENVGDIIGGIYRTIFSVGGGGFGGGLAVAETIHIPAVIGAMIGSVIAPGVGTLIGAGVGAASPAIIGLIVPLILVIALIVQFFRLLFQLVSSYVSLLIATIAGPLVIVFSSIPGRGGVLGWWWRSLLGNALVFPAVFAAFLFAGMILWLPTETFSAQPPLFGGLSTELLRLILAYGIILGTPTIPQMVKKAMGVKGPEGFAQAAFAGFAAGGGAARSAANTGLHKWQIAREAHENMERTGQTAGVDRLSPGMKTGIKLYPVRAALKILSGGK